MATSLVSDGFSMDGTAAGSAETLPRGRVLLTRCLDLNSCHSNAGLPVGKADVVYRTRSTASRPRRGEPGSAADVPYVSSPGATEVPTRANMPKSAKPPDEVPHSGWVFPEWDGHRRRWTPMAAGSRRRKSARGQHFDGAQGDFFRTSFGRARDIRVASASRRMCPLHSPSRECALLHSPPRLGPL